MTENHDAGSDAERSIQKANNAIALSRFRLGPAVLVTAAFVGPGTVLTASKAGADFGFTLLWAILFSVFATIVLQEMASRLGIATGKGLAESVGRISDSRLFRYPITILILSAILIGNSAYQTGNLVGAASGLEMIAEFDQAVLVIAVATLATICIVSGGIRTLQWILTVCVAAMGVIFLVAAVCCWPAISDLIARFFFPSALGQPVDSCRFDRYDSRPLQSFFTC